jgi:transcriptional regulator with XRE-family HTH domain
LSFYDKYYELCMKAGTTPTRAAIEMGFHRGTPTKWKNMPDKPQSLETLQRVSNYFGIPVSELLETKKSALESESGHKIIIDPTTEEIKAHLPSLTTEEKEALLRLVKVMKDNRKR